MGTVATGTHLVHVTAHILTKTGTGKEQLAITFEDEEGNRITWYGYFTEKTIDRTMETLAILGWDAEKYDHRIASLHDTDILVGAEAEIVVEAEEYEGRTRHKVRWVNAVGAGGAQDPLSAGEAADFSERMRAAFITAKGPQPNRAPRQAPPGAALDRKPVKPAPSGGGGGPDDDIPF